MPEKLRIATLMLSHPSHAGGIQEYIYRLAHALEQDGHTVSIFGPEGKPILAYRSYNPICRSIPFQLPTGNRTIITVPYLTKSAATEIFSSNRFDILHIHDPAWPWVPYGVLTSVRIPVVATFHTGWKPGSAIAASMESVLPLFRDTAGKYLHGCVYVSEHIRSCWEPLVPKTVPQKVIYAGVSDDRIAPSPRKTNSGRLIFVGRFVKRKHPLHAVEVMKLLRGLSPAVFLDFAGDGPESGALERMIKTYRFGKRIRMRGVVTGNRKSDLYRQSDIFLAPYEDEGFPLTILEAIAAGLPVVGYDIRPLRESITDSDARSLLTKPKDPHGLAASVRRLMQDPDLYGRISEWSVMRARDFRWEHTAREMVHLYRQARKLFAHRNDGG